MLLPGRHRYSRLALASWHLAMAFAEGAVADAPPGVVGDFRLRWAESGDRTEYAMGLLDERGEPLLAADEATDPPTG